MPDFIPDSRVTMGVYTLAPLTNDLPIIKTSEGNYVPLRALCEIVGLPPAVYIGKFCQQFKELNAMRRLLWKRPGGKQQEWCLDQKFLPMWLMELDLDQVAPAHREVLEGLQQQCMIGFSQVYGHMGQRQHEVREEVFEVLKLCERVEGEISQWYANGITMLADSCHQELIDRLKKGNALVDALAASARRTLAAIMEGPVVDGVVLGADGKVKDTVALPLLPVVQKMEPEATTLANQLGEWLHEFAAWWKTQPRKRR